MIEKTPAVQRPRVILAEHVIDKIVEGALLYPAYETGEAMIGLLAPQPGRQEPDIYVLDTLRPGEYAVRQWGMFALGDDWQGDVFDWLYWNWESFRELRRPSYGNALAAKWDLPLTHVGDWHKQPGDMVAPSGMDVEQARAMIADETALKHVVAPIVTMYPLGTALEVSEVVPDKVNTLDGETDEAESVEIEEEVAYDASQPLPSNAIIRELPEKGRIVRIDFWYMSEHIRNFVPITPEVWVNNRLPVLPPVPWHLAHPRRFDQEYDLLRDAGYSVDVVRWDADGRPPYEICFSIYKPGAHYVVLLVTSHDYPNTMPGLRTAPLVSVEENEDVFEKLYEASKPLLITQQPDWQWDSKRTLIELVWHIEKVLEGNKVP